MEYLRQEEEGEEVAEPVSPNAQYLNSSVLSISVLAVLEFEIPFDDSLIMSLLRDVFLPINPRFSTIMVSDSNGVKRWKKVEVKLKDHVNIPIFPAGLSPESYDGYLDYYLSKIAMEQLPQSQPLWEIHIIKYPTSNAAGNMIFKLHHALGDGYSFMTALFSCLKRADDPSLPLTFPQFQMNTKLKGDGSESIFRSTVPRVLSSVFNTISDFVWSLVKSRLIEDDRSPIRSGDDGVEFRPITITTIMFSLDHIKQIKTKLGGTVNDVITGTIFLGTRLYMEAARHGSSNAHSTALVPLNTRNLRSYKSLEEMLKPDTDAPWGNHYAILHVSIPRMAASGGSAEFSNPLSFVWKARQIITRMRTSWAVFLTGRLLEAMTKFRGPEATAKHIHSTLKNSSMVITNLIGPLEQMALADHPVRGFYFMPVCLPQSLVIGIVSYMGKLRVAVGSEKGLIDPQKFKSCMENAFEMIYKAACKAPLPADS